MAQHIAPGQRWRNPTGPNGPEVVTVTDVDGTTVAGNVSPEKTPGVSMVNAYSVEAFETFTLLDPAAE